MFEGKGGLQTTVYQLLAGGHNDKVSFCEVVKLKVPQTFSASELFDHSRFPSQPAAALDSSSREVTDRDPGQQTPLCGCRRRATRSARSVDLDSRGDAPSISVGSCAAARLHRHRRRLSCCVSSHGRLLRAGQSG